MIFDRRCLPRPVLLVFSVAALFSTGSDRLASALKFLAIETALGLERRDWIDLLVAGEN